ncbi:MAG TPA: DUF4105 domain-containing protein [Steroidobacteraceae bacterium]
MSIATELLEPLALAALSLLLILPAAWGVVALWYQAAGGRLGKFFWILLWLVLALAFVADIWRGHAALGTALFTVQFALLLLWWHRIPPSNDRPWADDVARMSHGRTSGDIVTLYEVRNFDWQTRDEYRQRWETRSYDLNDLHSVDMILSYWTGPAIAHMLMSFGFANDEQVAFSVEIRRERGEAFSEIGGFFKQFELSIIACDERDVVRVRTNVRGEDAYLYRLNVPPSAMRSLFLGYVEEANKLIDTPRFYNTITVNCTTLVYHMMKRIVGYLPLDPRVLFTGYLAGYVYRVGGLDQRYSLDELTRLGHITERARRSDRSDSFSADIRRTIPPLEC